MDIYEYLKLDHEHVNQLFKQFEQIDNKDRQVQIITLLAQELLVHAKSEQETFYKVLKHHYESSDEVFHGEKEHNEIIEQVDQILSSNHVNAAWVKQVDKLKELVTHHVKEEEGDIFNKAKKVLSETQAYELKEQMHYLKQKLLRKLEHTLKNSH